MTARHVAEATTHLSVSGHDPDAAQHRLTAVAMKLNPVCSLHGRHDDGCATSLLEPVAQLRGRDSHDGGVADSSLEHRIGANQIVYLDYEHPVVHPPLHGSLLVHQAGKRSLEALMEVRMLRREGADEERRNDGQAILSELNKVGVEIPLGEGGHV